MIIYRKNYFQYYLYAKVIVKAMLFERVTFFHFYHSTRLLLARIYVARDQISPKPNFEDKFISVDASTLLICTCVGRFSVRRN